MLKNKLGAKYEFALQRFLIRINGRPSSPLQQFTQESKRPYVFKSLKKTTFAEYIYIYI